MEEGGFQGASLKAKFDTNTGKADDTPFHNHCAGKESWISKRREEG